MKNIVRVELVWVDCYCEPHMEHFICHASAVDDASCDAMECISAMPTFLNFKTLSLFRLEDSFDVTEVDEDEA